MPEFSATSKERLATCHPELQRLFNEVIKHFDHTIACGYRNKIDQDVAYATRKSNAKWPNSKHNKTPSLAVDAYPYPVNFKDIERICYFAGWVEGAALSLGIKIRWGGDWNQNTITMDETIHDKGHFELAGEEYE
jgi:peptidoglycan L-alanyl-D-glutamate endopeptidase CwlK